MDWRPTPIPPFLLLAVACASIPPAAVPITLPPAVVQPLPPAPVVAPPPAPAPVPEAVPEAAPTMVSWFFVTGKTDVTAVAGSLADVGEYLRRHPEMNALVEGHCDERGSAAYNVKLGQRRAEAVALQLMANGARELRAVSYGKSKPRAFGHTEAAWAQNRRVDVTVE